MRSYETSPQGIFRISRIPNKTKYIVFILVLIVTSIIYLFKPWQQKNQNYKHCLIDQHSPNDTGRFYGATKLPDILEDPRKPRPGKSIFFHETACSETGLLKLTSRQACSVESAAVNNPESDVFVLFVSPVYMPAELDSKIISSLLTYQNIFFRNVNLWQYAENSPASEWFLGGELFQSEYVISHTSDFLRYLTLWRWGGTYLDLDVVVKESLEAIPPNYAGAESENFIAAGVINIDNSGFGHRIAELCLKNFYQEFRGDDWGHNGPGVITRVMKRDICKVTKTQHMTAERCKHFKVYPKEAFYAINWWNAHYFFDERYTMKTMNATQKSLVIHVWNNKSKDRRIRVGSQAAYGLYADKFCPKVYSSCGDYF